MLDYLAAHRELFGAKAECTAMTVVAAVPPQVTHFIAKQVLDDYFSDEAQKTLKPIEVFAKRHEHQIATMFRVGNAANLISGAATTGKFDLLIMGIAWLLLGDKSAPRLVQFAGHGALCNADADHSLTTRDRRLLDERVERGSGQRTYRPQHPPWRDQGTLWKLAASHLLAASLSELEATRAQH